MNKKIIILNNNYITNWSVWTGYVLVINFIKDTLNAFDDFKSKQKSVWSSVFLTCESVYILKVYSRHYTWDKTQMLKEKFLRIK